MGTSDSASEPQMQPSQQKKGKTETHAASNANGSTAAVMPVDHGLEVMVTVYDHLASSPSSAAAAASSSSSSSVSSRRLTGSHLRVGTCAEFIGVLSCASDLAASMEFNDVDGLASEVWGSRRNKAVRMHALLAIHIDPTAPLIADPMRDAALFQTQHTQLTSFMPAIRASLIDYMRTQLFGGDGVASEMFLLFMLQRLHKRATTNGGVPSIMPGSNVGKLTLNLIAPRPTGDGNRGPHAFAQRLTRVVESLMPRSTTLPLTIDQLNAKLWQPKKNYETESLDRNLLQLPSPSVLLLDESRLAAGTLNSVGLTNLRVLSKLIQMSVLEYDFEYQSLEFAAEQAICIISNGARTVLSQQGDMGIDLHMRIKHANQEEQNKWYEQCLNESDSSAQVSEQQMDYWRAYLLVARNSAFTIDEQIGKSIQEYFVALRKVRPTSNESTLNLLLNMARLSALSHMESSLSLDRWQATTRLFEQVMGERK